MSDTAPEPVRRCKVAAKVNPVSLSALFVCFFLIGCVSLAGDPTAFMERDLVGRRLWLTEGGFRSLRILSRITPGLPSISLTIAIGRRLAGGAGTVVATTAMLVVPILLAVGVGFLYGSYGSSGARSFSVPVAPLQPFLSGLAAASAGLAFAASVTGIRRIGLTLGHAAIILFMAGSLAFWDWPIILVVVLSLPLSFAVATLRRKKEDGDV